MNVAPGETIAKARKAALKMGRERIQNGARPDAAARVSITVRQSPAECGIMNGKEFMAATVEISVPDALVKALGAQPEELPRQTLEALIIQAYRKGQITHAQVGELLDLNRFETDGFLKNAQAFRARESEEFASDLERLRRLSK